MVWHGVDSLDILKGKPVTFDTLKGLRTTNQGLDILRFDFQDGRTIRNGSIVVTDLFVASYNYCCCCRQQRGKDTKKACEYVVLTTTVYSIPQ